MTRFLFLKTSHRLDAKHQITQASNEKASNATQLTGSVTVFGVDLFVNGLFNGRVNTLGSCPGLLFLLHASSVTRRVRNDPLGSKLVSLGSEASLSRTVKEMQ